MQTRHPNPTRAALALAALACTAFVAVATAPSAHAAPFVDVTYDLSDSTAISTIPAIGVTTEVPPHGSLSGTQTLRYASDSASGLATGSVDLLTFNLYVHAIVGDYTYTPNGTTFTVLNTADLHIQFLSLTAGATKGQRLAGGTITPLGASGVFRVTGTLHCYRLCAAIEAPLSTPTPIQPDTFTAPLPRLTGAVGPSYTVQGTATGVTFIIKPQDSNLGVGVTGTTFIVGREVQRTPVPEPSTLPLLAGGLAALGIAAAAWRRRTRS